MMTDRKAIAEARALPYVYRATDRANGVEASVYARVMPGDGPPYIVNVRDTDADEHLPSHPLFWTQAEAIACARKIAGPHATEDKTL